MITIPKVVCAGTEDPAALKKKREQLRKDFLNHKKVEVGGTFVPGDTILAAVRQWYEKDPLLFEAEKDAMRQAFPAFRLDTIDDGRLCWVGSLKTGLIDDREWFVMAAYNPDHGQKDAKIEMGGTVKIYLIDPDINELIEKYNWRPHHLLADSNNDLYICTTEEQFVKVGNKVTSAAWSLRMALKWISCYELVLSGEMTKEEFDKPHNI